MEEQQESAITSAVALFVLFSALLDPQVSSGLAVFLLFGLSLYKYFLSKREGDRRR